MNDGTRKVTLLKTNFRIIFGGYLFVGYFALYCIFTLSLPIFVNTTCFLCSFWAFFVYNNLLLADINVLTLILV